jgi:hypothetical protein
MIVPQGGMKTQQDRPQFLAAAAGAAAFAIVPRHVLGHPPSDRITLAPIGAGAKGLTEMLNLLPVPELQIVAVCGATPLAISVLSANPLRLPIGCQTFPVRVLGL